LFWKFLQFAEKLSFQTASISIASNESYRRIAIKRGGMQPERVFVVRSGPDLQRIKGLAPNPRWRNGRKFLVGYVGVIGQSEGIDLLLLSVQHIVRTRKRSDIQFVVVGNGPEWQTMTTLCSKMELIEYVTFPGRVDDATLFTILSTANVCVNPDRVNIMNDISTMNKVMEYMALGKPIVQFDVREGRFSAQEASLYAKPNDPVDFAEKILQVIDDPQRQVLMGEFGRQRVDETLAWQHEEPKLLQAYDSLFALRESRNGWLRRVCAFFAPER
jgi:glycosyltransferase involved in cell wall biosynthesis